MIVDQYYQDTRVLLKMQGTNGSQVFTDSSLTGAGVVAIGNTQIQSNAAVFDGANDALRICLPHAAQSLQGSDFVIEAVITTSQNTQHATIIGNGYAEFSADMWNIRINTTASNGLVAFYAFNFHATTPLLVSTTAVNDGVDHTIAVHRSGSNWTLTIDGVSEDTAVWAGDLDSDVHADIVLGGDAYYGRWFNGTIKVFRVTMAARYAIPFTPPAVAAYYDYAATMTLPIDESTDITKWKLTATRVSDGAFAGSVVTDTNSATLNLLYIDRCNVSMAPYYDYVWGEVGTASVGDLCIPTNTELTPYVFECTTGGAIGGGEPSWNIGGTTNDGSAVWTVVDGLVDPVSIGPKIPS